MVIRFLSYTEIKTKITSIFAFLMGAAFLFYINQPIDWEVTAVFFISMFVFDLATTSINNYIDTKSNQKPLPFKRKTAFIILIILLGISTGSGLLLVFLTDVVVLIVGGICFLCGIFYTFGPLPISRLPLGEVMSGVFYGFFIPFLLFYINMPKGTYLNLSITWNQISIYLNVMPIITVILLSIPPVCTTANIMLANNICDVKEDIAVKRYTLAHYLGEKSLHLYAGIYYASYIATILMVVLNILSPICLLSLFTLFFVKHNIKQFYLVQDKETTFILSIKNYLLIMGTNTVLIFISALF